MVTEFVQHQPSPYTKMFNNLNKDVVTYEVHIFSDLSELAYGAVAYLKLLFTDGTSTLSFLLVKSRRALVKTVSLPRLELNAAVIGVRIAQVIKKEMSLPLSIFKYWTDSTLTLQYITDKSHRFKVYVANRVAEILEYTDTDDWQHIDGKMNLADICTRAGNLWIQPISYNEINIESPGYSAQIF